MELEGPGVRREPQSLTKGFDGARSREESTHVRNNTRRAPDGSLRNTAGAARTPRHDPPRGGKGFQSRAVSRKSTQSQRATARPCIRPDHRTGTSSPPEHELGPECV